MRSTLTSALVLSATITAALAQKPQGTRLLRFPDLHGDEVVFTYGGDLWKAPLAGGTAVHLTSAKGVELFAKFSPDGRWIAFTGQIDGDEQVYVVPTGGGECRQLTHYPARGPLPDRWGWDNQVQGWTPDGTAVLFRSLCEAWTTAAPRLYTVAVGLQQKKQGAMPVPLPMPTAGAGDFSPDGRLIAYSPLFRDFRTWKRYQGGWASELYVFDPATGTAENITRHPRTDRDPMWIGDRIYFASDRTGTLNLWSYDPQTSKAFQETFSEKWDVRWPSAGGPGENRIVYEKGGELCWFDTKTREEHPIVIRVPDEALLRRPSVISAAGFVEGAALSPGGGRAAFAAHGEILTLPKENGDVRNLTHTPGAHDKQPAFSPDGRSVAYVSDRSGEEQIWLQDHLGLDEPVALTQGLKGMLYTPVWSPDGKWIAFGDKDGVLRIVEIATKVMTQVADEAHGQMGPFAWSPCSGYLALTLTNANELPGLSLYHLADKSLTRISRPLAHDSTPVWDGKGERLFFLGLRGFEPRLATTYEWDFEIDRAYGVYALALRKDLGPWLPARSDEAVPAKKDDSKAPEFTQPIAIDVDGLAERVEALPIGLDNWAALETVDGGLLLLRTGGGFYGRGPDRPASLHFFSADKRELTELHGDVGGFSLSPDKKHLLLAAGGKYFVCPASAAAKDDKKELHTSELRVERVPADEWWQIFQEVWRRYRDFFYVDNLHGFDWEALREQYAPLVAHVRHRSDLNYVIGEMIAELNVGHAYISGGDIDAPPRPTSALPGCQFAFDPVSGRYRIAHLLAGENDDPVYRSPLREVGVDARQGDYLIAIDGEEVTAEVDPYLLLRDKAGKRVTLSLNQQPQAAGARKVTFSGIPDEHKLFYLGWVQKNRQRVAQLSGGKLGYVHMPDMGAEGLREFIKQYYCQRDKEGLVIDDRYNGGGNVSQMVLNRLCRKLLMVTFGRTSGMTTYPRATFQGHLVCLLNESSASDGDIFPAMFRRAGLGQLVGKRSWGGIIGITNRGTLIDGGTVNVPEFGNTEPDGVWTIEGHGVDPDVVVENDVSSLLQGRDPQLEKGVEILLQKLQKEPRPVPVRPAAPVKTGR